MKEVHLHFSNTELQLNSKRRASLDLQLDCVEWPQQHKVPQTWQCGIQAQEHVYVFMYIGVNAKERDLHSSAGMLGSITVITINRSFHRTFSKLKYKHLLMLTTLLKHSWS